MNGGSVFKEVISAIALGTTIIGLVPQIYHTYEAKSAQDLSMPMLGNYVIGSVAWIIYGCIEGDTTVTLANIFCCTTALISIWQKVYYDNYYTPLEDRLMGNAEELS
jgi:uncharacterized protein with PQ loop repeat